MLDNYSYRHTIIIIIIIIIINSNGFIPGGSVQQCNTVQYKNNTIQ